MMKSQSFGDVRAVIVEPFDFGHRALIAFEMKKPITIKGESVKVFGAVFEEGQIQELVDGLAKVANMRQTQRIIAAH
jgi:hypothetical protein